MLTSDISVLSKAFGCILDKIDIVVQVLTGGISEMNIVERCYPLNYEKAESASLNGGSKNLGESVYHNSFDDIKYCTKMRYEKSIIPEIEVIQYYFMGTVLRMVIDINLRNRNGT